MKQEKHNPEQDAIKLMLPLLAEIGKEQLNDPLVVEPLFQILETDFKKSRNQFSSQLIDQMMFAVVAIKKYNVTVEKAIQLIKNKAAIHFCFGEYVMKGNILDRFIPMHDGEGNVTGVQVFPPSAMVKESDTKH